MKFKFIALMLGAIVVLSSAFSPTTKAPEKPNNHLKVMKDVMAPDGNIKQIVIAELSNYTTAEREIFISKILKANKIAAFQCKACTAWKGDTQGSGWCTRTCCYPGPSGCVVVFQEQAECCAIPPDEPSC